MTVNPSVEITGGMVGENEFIGMKEAVKHLCTPGKGVRVFAHLRITTRERRHTNRPHGPVVSFPVVVRHAAEEKATQKGVIMKAHSHTVPYIGMIDINRRGICPFNPEPISFTGGYEYGIQTRKGTVTYRPLSSDGGPEVNPVTVKSVDLAVPYLDLYARLNSMLLKILMVPFVVGQYDAFHFGPVGAPVPCE